MAVAFPFSQAELLGQLGAHRYADSLVIQDGLALWYDVADAHGQIVTLSFSLVVRESCGARNHPCARSLCLI